MKPKILFYLFFIILLSMGNSCEKDNEILLCSENHNSINDMQIIDLGCFLDKDIEYVIKDDLTYQAIFQPCKNSDSTYVLPYIDFSRKTLLGKYSTGICTDENFIRKVCKNDDIKEYEYIVKLKSGLTCYKPYYSMNWVIIPKIPANYNVIFFEETS